MNGLQATATTLLKKHGSAEKASAAFARILAERTDLRAAIALDYLQRVAGQDAGAAKGQSGGDDRPTSAPAAPAASKGSIKVTGSTIPPHRRRTQNEIEADRAAMRDSVEAIYGDRLIDGRPIGSMTYGELHEVARDSARDAASFLRLGTQKTEDALLALKIINHAKVDDTGKRTRDIVSAQQLAQYDQQARLEAAQFIEAHMHRYADDLQKGRIAHGTST